MILILLLFATTTNAYINNWFPISTVSCNDFNNPRQIRLLGKDFVLWKKDNQLIFQDDSCPHRCAPLSEGYIDSNSKNLRCAYHGWEFNEKGTCTVIPQADFKQKLSFKKACIKNYPTFEYGDMLWAYMGNDTNVQFPKDIYDLDNSSTFMRELPFSLYILLENFVDPAHIPYAHHKLQSTRDNGSPIEIKQLSLDNDTKILSMMFKENNFNNPKSSRAGVINFRMPCHYYVDFKKPDSNLLSELHIFVVPVQEDICRIFIKYKINNKNLYLKKIFNMLPIWLIHIFINRFLDSDTLILHKQDQYLLKNTDSYHSNKEYYLPTESDKGVSFYRKWIKKTLPTIPSFYKIRKNNELTRHEILDRYEQHTKECIHCKIALENIKNLRLIGSLILLILYFLTNNLILIPMLILNYIFSKRLEDLFIFDDYVHNNID